MYVRQNSQPNRLGSFEKTPGLGQIKSIYTPTSFAAPTEAGMSTANVLTGIGQILAPLAQAGGAIYAAKIQSDAEKKMMKIQQQQLQQQQEAAMMAAMQAAAAQPGQSSTTPIVIAILGGTALIALLAIVLMRKGK